jgi:hypothetical protein
MYEFASDHHVYVEIDVRLAVARYDVFEARLVYRGYGFILRDSRPQENALHWFLPEDVELVVVVNDMVTGC